MRRLEGERPEGLARDQLGVELEGFCNYLLLFFQASRIGEADSQAASTMSERRLLASPHGSAGETRRD
jgi:hypothetical protein